MKLNLESAQNPLPLPPITGYQSQQIFKGFRHLNLDWVAPSLRSLWMCCGAQSPASCAPSAATDIHECYRYLGVGFIKEK